MDRTYSLSNTNGANNMLDQTNLSSTDPQTDTRNMANMVEAKIGYYNHKLVISANGYPVYIGENPFGFIPYVVVPIVNTHSRFGEGIPYLIAIS